MKLAGRLAVVTGAAGGIGRGISQALARRGCNLALCDRDAAGLNETAALLRDVKVSTHQFDVTDRAATAALPEQVLAQHGRVDVLVNNAGVACGGTFAQVSEDDFDWLMDVNFNAVVRLTRAFLPHLEQSDDARIINISSLFGLIAPPGNAAYCASKFAVRGFSESLRKELEESGSSVGVTTVHPGGVRTNIANNARAPKGLSNAENDLLESERERFTKQFLVMPPEQAGEVIVAGAERGKARVIVGKDAKAGALFERLMPVGYWKILRRSMS
jgi:short-subunit dehydrogenase